MTELPDSVVPRSQSRHRLVAACASALLLVACGSAAPDGNAGAAEVSATRAERIAAPSQPPSTSSTTTIGPSTTSQPAPIANLPAPTSAIAQVGTPTAVQIPTIGVDSPVIPLGLLPDGSLEAPEDYHVAGWYEDGPEPGEAGASVIAAHVDSKSGPAVFYRLKDLKPGDLIAVLANDGGVTRFSVDSIQQFPKDEFPTELVYTPTLEPTLRLITCGGDFDRGEGHYRDNIVVFASPASD